MPPPRGGGALLRNLSDNSAHSEAFLSGQNATQNGATNLTPQEQLLAGTLELDPENDPIIATTDWGLDIKFHNAGEYQGAGYLVNNPSTNSITLGSTNYAYVSMGKYGGNDVNWIIIGYSTNPAEGTNVVKATGLGIPDESDAGNVVSSASSNGQLVSTQYLLNEFSSAVPSKEIPAGCVLVISQGKLYDTTFGKYGYYYYTNSTSYSNLRA
ncbi:MAG: hypothetical protein ACLRFR_00925, partial [Clostridia bacterium]